MEQTVWSSTALRPTWRENALSAAANGPTSKGSSIAVKKSIIGSFRSHRVRGLPLIVVDDLVESGATLRAAAIALRSGGGDPLANIAAVVLN